jgi:site-specific recombinase XerC
VSQGELAANPAKGISAPKIPRHLPKNIDVDDVNRLLDIDLNDPLAVRDRAMLEVMYGAGLRLSELVNLDIKHLDLESGEVWVMGKGSKERRLPIGRNAVGGLSTGWICAACSALMKTRCFCQSWANVFPRVTCRSALPSGALSRG